MSVLKFSARAALVALAMLLASGQAAMAETKMIVCTDDDYRQAGKLTIDFDQTKGTVTVDIAASTRTLHNGSTIDVPGNSMGTLPATFGPKTITFDYNANGSYAHYTIDRVTLEMLAYASEGAPFDQAAARDKVPEHYTCHVAKPQI
jgi:hypothetical protein